MPGPLPGRGSMPPATSQGRPAAPPVIPTAAPKRAISLAEVHNTQTSNEIFQQYKKQRPTDRALPTALLSHDAGLVALSDEYEKLLEYEKNLDSLYARKKVELMEDSVALKRTVHKRLRVRISNTCSDQDWQRPTQADKEQGTDQAQADRPDFDSGKGIPSWTVKIEGKLLDVSRSWSGLQAGGLGS